MYTQKMTNEDLFTWEFSIGKEKMEEVKKAMEEGKKVEQRFSSFNDGDFCQILIDDKTFAHVDGLIVEKDLRKAFQDALNDTDRKYGELIAIGRHGFREELPRPGYLRFTRDDFLGLEVRWMPGNKDFSVVRGWTPH